jgi:hypothetical protein
MREAIAEGSGEEPSAAVKAGPKSDSSADRKSARSTRGRASVRRGLLPRPAATSGLEILRRVQGLPELGVLPQGRWLEVEPLKSRAGMLSQLNVLSAQLGALPATALERPDAIEDVKAKYANRPIATTNRHLARLRHVCNWAIGRDLLTKTAFHPRGVRIAAKSERRRERRVSEAEEHRLLEA